MIRFARTVGALLAGALGAAGCGDGEGGPTSPAPAPGNARVERVEIVSEPAAGETYLAGEELAFGVWLASGEAVEAVGEIFLVFDLGLAREPARLTHAGEDRLEFRYRIRRGDYDGDGVGVPGGELTLSPGASLRVGGAELDLRLPELPPVPEHRVFARYSPGEALAFDATLDGFPANSLGLPGAAGCAAPEDIVPVVEAVLEGNLPGAANRWSVGFGSGRCAILGEGEPAIFLSAAVSEHEGAIYDLVLAYGPGEAIGGARRNANWWTLGDFLAPASSGR